MQKVLDIRGIRFGEGKPKICVPIVGKDRNSILSQVKLALDSEPDMLELRADWFEKLRNVEEVLSILKEIRELIAEKILLFTIRTCNEGGEADITVEEYETLCTRVCESGWIDLIDVEAYICEGVLERISQVAHKNHIYVIGSNHDFKKTPDEREIVHRLLYMQEHGADIPKIAVMPQQERDVLSLLSATLSFVETEGMKPVITMSMGKMGMISRMSGELCGSAVTFATVGQSSAPGQIEIDEIKHILDVLHSNK